MDSEESGGLIPAAQDALARAMHAAGIGLAALLVGMVAACTEWAQPVTN